MSRKPIKMVFDLGDKVRVSPPIWPNNTIDVQPGDLSQFAPKGNGVYGLQICNGGDPFKSAPPQEENGGIIYFGNNVSEPDYEALMRIMGVPSDNGYAKSYVVFVKESENPGKDGYLTQMRIVSDFGMCFLFDAISDKEMDRLPEQNSTIVEALSLFMQKERERWRTSFSDDAKNGLSGLFGGDGDFAREELSFGFMPENSYHHVYRIWSRAWLVTK